MVALVSLLLAVVACSQTTALLPDASTRADQTFQGLMRYYWRHDPASKNIGFFFACGQIGGFGTPDAWNKCGCYTPAACTNCYRWWDAIAMEALANYGIYTNTKQYANIPDSIFAHSPYNAKWNATKDCTFIDDFSWYGIAYLRVYEWLKDPKWLQRSVAIYNWTWDNGWDKECGGFWWNTCDTQLFKDSVTIMEIMHFGAKLAYMFPKEKWYLESAQKIWDWVFSFDNGRGLMAENNLVSTGAVPEQCCNATNSDPLKRCVNSNISGTSYNQGLLMSASAYLYNRTKNETYLNTGLKALAAILANYTTKDGLLIDEARGYQTYQYQCFGWADPGGDWFSFQGIFMNHLSYFTTLLYENKKLPADMLSKIAKLIQSSSDSAWTKSAVHPPFKLVDACNTDSPTLNVSFPKFHWWWANNSTTQIIPSDPRLFFHKTQLRCVGNETQLWEGMLKDEGTCMLKCKNNTNCSKYLFQTPQSSSVGGLNCWIWSYNRSDHTCHQGDYGWNVGIKRPIGYASCAKRCGSKEPIELEHGVCYCDSQCEANLDCCIDYANQCHPKGYVPSCKGLCNKHRPLAVVGGGYCWCMGGCNPWYTDNNSDGSCCPDYNQQCLQLAMPDCLDARSQGSALNLFISHLKLTQIVKTRP